jgi:iron(II)-dependent oxidoreductase
MVGSRWLVLVSLVALACSGSGKKTASDGDADAVTEAVGPGPDVTAEVQADTAPEQVADTSDPACTGDPECAPGVCDLGRCWPAPAAMVTVPAGPFFMGCDGVRDPGCEINGLGGYFDQPYHQVITGAFRIDVLETTVAEYAHCVAAGACTLPEANPPCTWLDGEASLRPITCVTWDQAGAYCAWRGARRCTEAEWEKAARGGCETLPADQQGDCQGNQWLNPWGNQGATCAVAVMNETGLPADDGCGTGGPVAVGARPEAASPYGVQDSVGNVGEWQEDCFEQDYNGAPADGSARTQCTWPVGDWQAGKYRVNRGGGWNRLAGFNRGAQRGADGPLATLTTVGIRCCKAAAE